MAVVKVKPTSPGRRAVVKVVHKHLHKGAPEASLLEPQKQNSGRNNNGHITMRHKGGGHKHHYRVVDFVRNKDGIPAKVERIEYDPNRTAHIALVCYADGERRYIIAPRGLEVGASLMSGAEAFWSSKTGQMYVRKGRTAVTLQVGSQKTNERDIETHKALAEVLVKKL